MPMKNPPHPGDFIRTEIIEPAGLSVTAMAAAPVRSMTLPKRMPVRRAGRRVDDLGDLGEGRADHSASMFIDRLAYLKEANNGYRSLAERSSP